MHIISYIFIFCLMLSGVANASMVCCGSSQDSTQQEQAPDTPCHGNYSDEMDNKNTDDHDCDCPTCFQTSGIINPDQLKVSTFSSFYGTYTTVFYLVDPDSIFYPPKPIS